MINIIEEENHNLRLLSTDKIQDLLNRINLLSKKKNIIDIGDIISVTNSVNNRHAIKELIFDLKPWRIGPFKIFDYFIDSEWKSYIKYNIIKDHIDIKDKDIADIGCQNGYFMFRFKNDGAKSVCGFDPSAFFYTQFMFLNHFMNLNIDYKLLGVEFMHLYEKKFDVIFCMGVLYHRVDPISTLKAIKMSTKGDYRVLVDTLILDRSDDLVLFPKNTRYAKMPNVYYIPSINVLKSWCSKAGFKKFDVIKISKTTIDEQRVTKYSGKESLSDFLSNDKNKTIEGYPPPIRAYIMLSD